MPVFEYRGKTVTGSPVEGELKAKDRGELERLLRRNRILVDRIAKKPSQINIRIGTGIKKVYISRFTRQFATMIGAGLPMVQCLEILAKQMESLEFRKIVANIQESVSAGSTLSEAMGKHKKVFDDLYVNMVEAGEMGGALDTIL
ncbi:MAG: type II secretion system F family protein, partial [bacterium]